MTVSPTTPRTRGGRSPEPAGNVDGLRGTETKPTGQKGNEP